MKIAIAVDDRGGVMFNGRRQSQDIHLREHLLALAGDAPLKMNTYSAKQFKECPDRIAVADDFLETSTDGLCFVENTPLAPHLNKITALYLCRWNRDYPSDQKLDIDLSTGWALVQSQDIVGKSHEKITVDEWRKAP